MSESIISLTTDFGLEDAFVGIMKGIILRINPEVRIVDLCHEIPAGQILEASFVAGSAYKYFPERTIHVVVVDPGVGSERRPIMVKTDRYFFIAPDNGALSSIYQDYPGAQVFHLTQRQYFRSEISRTFHGRDIFAPVAAWLSTGLAPQVFGPEIYDYLKLEIPQPRQLEPNVFEFQILHIDHFGNLITTIRESFFRQALSHASSQRFRLEIASRSINHLYSHFASLPEPDQVGALFGSTGNLEIFTYRERADQSLGVHQGDKGRLIFL